MDLRGTLIIKQLKAYISRDLSHLGKLVTNTSPNLFINHFFLILEPTMHNRNYLIN